MLVLGLCGGAAAGYLVGSPVIDADVATPVPAASPAFPTTPAKTLAPYQPDVDYPALVTPSTYARREIGNGYQDWRYTYPKGWQAYCVTDGGTEQVLSDDEITGCAEVRFRPPSEPVLGGYSMRVKGIDAHLSTSTMVAQKIAALEGSPDLRDVRILSQTDASVYVTLRTPGNLLRYNFFAWYAAPGSNEATLEMSVTGREIDEVGLRGLFAAFGDRAAAVG